MAKKVEKKAKDTVQISDITYHRVIVECACGAKFSAGSTKESLRVDICSQCHPFFTGDTRVLDTEGRVQKFLKKYKLDEASKTPKKEQEAS